jgi:hypothetical protein
MKCNHSAAFRVHVYRELEGYRSESAVILSSGIMGILLCFFLVFLFFVFLWYWGLNS